MTSPERPAADLRQRAMQGVVWSLAQNWGAKFMTTAVFVVLARLLDPADFGLVALATLLVGFFALFSEQGFGNALVQRQDLDDEHLDSAFWFGVGMGVTLFVLTQVLAGPVAAALGEPRLEAVLRWLSLNFLIGSGKTTASALLRRELRFKSLAARALTANLFGGVAGVGLALAGAGVWALVAQNIVLSLMSAVALWVACDWRPRARFSGRHFREVYGFGAKVLGNDVLNFANRHADDFLIGVILGPVALGYYSVAYRILTLLTELFTHTITSAAPPTFSRLQADTARLRHALYVATRLGSLTAFPAFLGVAALAPELTLVVFGSQWMPAVPAMRVLALIGVLHSIMFFNSNVIVAVGRPGWSLALSGVNAVVNAAALAFVLAMGFGILGVAAALTVRGYLLSPMSLLLLRRLIDVDIRRYLRQIRPAALASLGMGASVVAATTALGPGTDPLTRLSIGVGTGITTYGLLILMLGRGVSHEAWSYVRMVFAKGGAA